MGLQLTISKGSLQGREFSFQLPEIHIGRTPDNDVVLPDAGVSRSHVRISERLGRYFIQDLGSANGTLVNDSPLTEERELADGDRLAVGPVELVFKTMVDEDEATRPIRRNLNPARAEPPASGPPVLTPSPEARKATAMMPVLPRASAAPAKEARKGTGQVPVLTPVTEAPPPPMAWPSAAEPVYAQQRGS